jgi:O-antigen ligase
VQYHISGSPIDSASRFAKPKIKEGAVKKSEKKILDLSEKEKEELLQAHQPFGLYTFNALVVLLIIFVQFQNILGIPIEESKPWLSHAIFLVDKILFFSLFLIFFFVRLVSGFVVKKDRNPSKFEVIVPLKSELIFLIPLVIFGIWCLLSGGINQNNLKVTVNGAYDYMAYFLVFFVFSSIPAKKSSIKKIYLTLLNFALFLSLISIFQEIAALVHPASVNWWPNILSGNEMWRTGLFRAPSLLGHPYYIGVFALFFWTIELARIKKRSALKSDWLKIFILGLAIAFSFSRAAIVGALIALVCLFSIRTIISSIPVILISLYLFAPTVPGVAPTVPGVAPTVAGVAHFDIYRQFCTQKSLPIIKEHPWFGVGPGMFGGHISIKYNSPIYAQYGFTGPFFDYLKWAGSIEEVWLQALAELGVVGLFLVIMLLLTPILILQNFFKQEKDNFLRILIIGLMIMPLQMLFYGLGFAIFERGEWLVPYFAFLGMFAGMQRMGKA